MVFFGSGMNRKGTMPVTALIPFRPRNPKTRLSCVLSEKERENLADLMIRDVVAAVSKAGCRPMILSTHPYSLPGIDVEVREAGLNEGLNRFLEEWDDPLLIIMADLPLVDSDAVKRLISTRKKMAIVPGRGGGTNAIYLSKASSFRVDYYGASFLKHTKIARERGLSCQVVDSFRILTDVDEKEDLVELLIHGTGFSVRYLEELGFSLSIEKGRVGVKREKNGDE